MNKEDFILNNVRIIEIKDKLLVTTDHNDYIFLEKNEYKNLNDKKLTPKLYSKLEEKGVIITKNNKQTIVKKLKEKYSHTFQGTALHIIETTLRCNQKCIYCHASSMPKNCIEYDMDEKTANKILNFIFQSPSHNINIEFQGGEPLLNFPILKFIVETGKELNKKHKKNLEFTLVTNLFHMDDEKLDFLEKNNIVICTSLDGPKFLHEKNRNLNTHQPTVDWIDKINEKRKNSFVPALPTITRYSLPYHKEIIDEYVKHNIRSIHLRFLNNLGNAKESWEKISYSADEFIEFWKKSIDYIVELNKKGIYLEESLTKIILTKLSGTDPNYMDLRSPCGAIIGQLLYNHKGDIYTCDEARMLNEDLFKVGNVFEDNYSKVINSNQSCSIISSSINDNQICDYCAYKPYCGICPVCNYAEQKSIISKIPQTIRCKIYKAQFEYIFEKLLENKETKEVFMSWLKTDKK
jgi:His-Xaa-Ser system radical SAM maturase HxsB